MFNIRRSSLLLLSITIFTLFVALVGAQQNALKLEWVLSGPAIGGRVPSGKATLDQPRLPGNLRVEIKNVNLPSGTVLTMSMGGYNAGTMIINNGQAQLQSQIPFQFRNGAVEVLKDGVAIMSGRFKN